MAESPNAKACVRVQLRELLEPRFLPMVCKPLPWTSYDKGGYILWRAPVLRHKTLSQLTIVRRPLICCVCVEQPHLDSASGSGGCQGQKLYFRGCKQERFQQLLACYATKRVPSSPLCAGPPDVITYVQHLQDLHGACVWMQSSL